MRKSRPTANPLQAGIVDFASSDRHTTTLDQKDIPKRYTRYGSLLLLGPTFPTHSVVWARFYSSLPDSDRASLFRSIVEHFKDGALTHVAINAPIAAVKEGVSHKEENVIRSPTGLLPVYGDFGPGDDRCDERYPTQADIGAAYWTQTVQLNDIVQVWAPRWTMFSRGNISEKARILQNDSSSGPFPGLTQIELGEKIELIDVADFYVGIGYFAFCYLRRGVARVWGWEINGWSVEGVRRGCAANGWHAQVVQIHSDGNAAAGEIERLVSQIKTHEGTENAVRCVVFWGDNKWVNKILGEVKSHMESNDAGILLNVRHCNLGLLPTSQNGWEGAVQILDFDRGGWLHVHENVDAASIGVKQQAILQEIRRIADKAGKKSFELMCHGVEQVKTYAPGVIHCVYDIGLHPSR